MTAENLLLAGLDPNAIDAATRAAERGVALDGVRIGDIVRNALDGGRLHIPDAGGAVVIADGRVTLSPLVAPAQGADVALTGSYDLAADALEVRFDLTGAARQNGPIGQRPALSVALKGPREAPRRSEDVSALVSWLTLRSVEQESKRLDAAERQARRIKVQEEEALRRAQEAPRSATTRPPAFRLRRGRTSRPTSRRSPTSRWTRRRICRRRPTSSRCRRPSRPPSRTLRRRRAIAPRWCGRRRRHW